MYVNVKIIKASANDKKICGTMKTYSKKLQ